MAEYHRNRWPTIARNKHRGYNDFQKLHNIHSVNAYFVVRGKKNNSFKPMKWKRRFKPESGILSDATGYMDGQLTMGKYPDKIRRIIYWDEENKRKFIFFTNALDLNPETVAELYHNRWQIELFFKWLKQHLKIKKFWDKTESLRANVDEKTYKEEGGVVYSEGIMHCSDESTKQYLESLLMEIQDI